MKKSEYISASQITGDNAGRKKIIYVDDVQVSLVSVKKRLQDRYEVYPAQSMIMLFNILENVMPDLILLDVNMPGNDGYKVIRSLKNDDRYKEIPVIFLTGVSDKESVMKGLSMGAADYIVKPFENNKLIECIEKQLGPSVTSKSPDMKKNNGEEISILVVDDVLSTLKAIQFSLDPSLKVHTLSESDHVIEFLLEKKMDLIMLDYLMPGLSGFDLLPLIRKLPGYETIPIIILTSEGTMSHLNEAISLGASDFMVKPFKPDELNNKIAKHLKK